MEHALLSFLVEVLPLLVTVLGLLLTGSASFDPFSRSERMQVAGGGIALIILGVCGIIWPVFVLVYLLLFIVGLVTFAGIGIYRSFG